MALTTLRDELIEKSKFLSEKEIDAFKNWSPLPISLDQQKFLTKEGEEELFMLGQRFKAQFPTFFKDESATKFDFKHTPTERTNSSALYFIEGLFDQSASNYQSIEVAYDDEILRPYKGCNLWRKNVKDNPESLREKEKFLQSHHVENMMNELKELTKIDYLDFHEVELIYTMCGFETAWRHLLFNEKSIWCSLFRKEEHLKIMEYLEDLEYFYIDGYGFEITRKLACKTVDDILKFLDTSDNTQKVSVKFTHSGTILKLITFLELHKDDFQLSGDKMVDDRNWRTSLIDSFASNIIVILYE